MARSVVLAGSERCERCELAPRWCICAGVEPVVAPVQVDVLLHHRERWRPTSTGRLINRVVAGSRGHVYRHDVPLKRDDIVAPGKTVWILHPLGEALPAARPEELQVLLLDGSWGEAAGMLHAVEPWGRRVCLPMAGQSRYWLRAQQGAGLFSTVEALIFLYDALGLAAAAGRLRLQFELHVYAGLRARGKKVAAEEFLADSPVRAARPELVAALAVRRPRV
jgi:DTW domain-containing protein YfiP